MAMTGRSLAKDFHNLLKNIHSMSGGQARVSEWDDEDLSTFEVEIAPTGGLYKYAKFKFQFELSEECYLESAPSIICATKIYHPNIDTIECPDSTNICVSLLDDWTEDNGLDDCVQALLFLFYNPNLEDPLCPGISSEMTDEEFEENVKLSLEGGDVDDVLYETNYGYLENDIIIERKTQNTEKEVEDNIRTVEEVNIETNEEMNKETIDEMNIASTGQINVESFKELNIEAAEKINIESPEKVNVETTGENHSLQSSDILKESKNADENKTEKIPKDADASKETNTNSESERTERSLVIKTKTETQPHNKSKFRQFCDKIKNLIKFLPNNRIHGSGMKSQVTSNNSPRSTSDLCVLDNLVPYNTLVSTMCSHFTRKMCNSKL